MNTFARPGLVRWFNARADRPMAGWVVVLALVAASPGCAEQARQNEPPAPVASGQARTFSSPDAAVPVINDLIRRSDWATLASYYDLSLTRQIREEELLSGRFFITPGASATSGPTAISRYRHPFPPGSRFLSSKPEGDPGALPCIWTVSTVLEIDQGGGAVQRVISECKMIQRKEGFRLLAPAPAA
ncbi:MAG: hypothetical protein ACT4PL_02910 [Phycisphaerales bacterium]